MAVWVGLILVLAACGGGDNAHNDADVSFAQGMIPHHEQAVVMSDLALYRADSDQIKELATRIKAAQGPEITQMQGWLEGWGVGTTTEGGDHGGDHAAGGEGMAGMMSDAEMRQLEVASGPQFDSLFLQGMIRHHEGAVVMAGEEQANGKFGDAKKLADNIIASQQAEITEMRALQSA